MTIEQAKAYEAWWSDPATLTNHLTFSQDSRYYSMTILEIAKMKTEHSRFKDALHNIAHEYSDRPRMAAYLMADSALNAPPPPPVTLTLKDILSALDRYKTKTGDYVAILFNPDESGGIKVGATEVEIFQFINLRQALDFLTR